SREPKDRFATAREMALALEQTIGLATPSEVGAWVESVAADEIHRRAARIADIESASVRGLPRAGVAGGPQESGHSQVSSISVSRPTVSVAPPASGRKPLWAVAAVVAVLGVAAAALGVRAMHRVSAEGGSPKSFAPESRSLVLLGPRTGPAKAVPEV